MKFIPKRMCIVCRQSKPKNELLRFVKIENNFEFDETQKQNNRGFYICNSAECVEKCIKKKTLNKVFKSQISEENYQKLRNTIEHKV